MIVGINDALKAIAYALLVLFFVIGVMKTCGSFTELKRPEVAFKCFIRFVLAQAAVTYGMELMTALFSIAQGAIQTISVIFRFMMQLLSRSTKAAGS